MSAPAPAGRPGGAGRAIGAATRVAAVIGDPVRHSRSPAIHNAAYGALGLDWVYVAFPVPAGRGAEAVAAVRTLGLGGMNVTMPHKADAATACDTLAGDAARLGAVNTVVPAPHGRLEGWNTDGDGLLGALAEAQVEPAGRRALVLGAGGAARAAVVALARAGARVGVAARRAGPAAEAAALAPGAVTVPWSEPLPVGEWDLVVNATPLGMGGRPGPALAGLSSVHAVVDLVYEPVRTPLLEAAEAAGTRAVDGLGMLVHQAARAFELMTGHPAPLPVMRAAARARPR